MQPDLQLFSVAVTLSTALVFFARSAVRAWLHDSHETPDHIDQDGHGFNSEAVRNRVDEVRRDFETAVRATHIDSPAHEELLAVTRRAIASLAYFRNRRGTL
ncbi:MAG TPA: hypothetical protein VK530_13550 [Candidatus Acidoferrum sp.]|nr:hypothetical protein [Candidatus Acidoferrum sp.]